MNTMKTPNEIKIEQIVASIMLSHASDEIDASNYRAWAMMIAIEAATYAADERERDVRFGE